MGKAPFFEKKEAGKEQEKRNCNVRECFTEEDLCGSSSATEEAAVAHRHQNGNRITEKVDGPR